VSAECKDLLTRLLVADSEQRLSMEDIKNHPWFTHALPSGAIQMNDWYMREANGIDEVQPAVWSVVAASHLLLLRGHQHTCVDQHAKHTRVDDHASCLAAHVGPQPAAKHEASWLQVMSRIDALIHQAQKRGSPGEPVISVTF
jgi:serine/threonine protein kinase